MNIIIVAFLLLIGILLFLAEIFLIPGISVAGISGFLFTLGAIIYAYARIGVAAGHVTLFLSIVSLAFAIWYFMRSKQLDKLYLHTEIDGKIDPLRHSDIQAGDIGVSISRLAPMGKVKVRGIIIEAKSPDDFLDENTPIEVVKVLTTNLIVKKADSLQFTEDSVQRSVPCPL